MSWQYLLKKLFGVTGIQVASKLLTLTISVVLARELGPENFGNYGFILSLLILLSTPAISGVNDFLVREVSSCVREQYHPKKIIYFTGAYSLTISVFLSIVLILFGSLIFGGENLGQYNTQLILLVFVRTLLYLNVAILNGYAKSVLSQFFSVMVNPIVLCVYIFFKLRFSEPLTLEDVINAYLSASSISLSMAFLASFIFIFRNDAAFVVQGFSFKDCLPSIFRLSAIGVISTANYELAPVLIGLLNDHESVAYYRVAMQMASIFVFFIAGVNVITSPEIAHSYQKGDKDKLQNTLNKVVATNVIISLPIVLAFIVFGEEIIIRLFGVEYRGAYIVLVVIVLAQFINISSGPVAMVLHMTGHENKSLETLTYSFIVLLLTMPIMTHLYGVNGAAFSAAIVMIYWNLRMAVEVKKTIGVKTWLSLDTFNALRNKTK
ncbi:lipopolysaccharide biosynthesis protein [Vibrio paucivorans]|uniref:Oligosaccharide flippase family protein n=1 Tax=Vibrio paucivorans TaxID=2829489 RepID=A0A9X3CD54_9VIBR|nr:oligosaccharide flippase family protein [Vibrio paucivorans]MCW8333617.1 oligosaccharide flippase family protein [Vibrio paucivorans]